MRRSNWSTWLVIMIAGLMTFGGVLDGGEAATADPDFSNVKDILGGPRHLLRNDDLVVSYGSDVMLGTSNTVLQTTNSSISNEKPRYDVGGGAQTNFGTAVGRIFNLSYDVIVSTVEWVEPVRAATGRRHGLFKLAEP